MQQDTGGPHAGSVSAVAGVAAEIEAVVARRDDVVSRAVFGVAAMAPPPASLAPGSSLSSAAFASSDSKPKKTARFSGR